MCEILRHGAVWFKSLGMTWMQKSAAKEDKKPAGTRLWRNLPTTLHLNSVHPIIPWPKNKPVVLNIQGLILLEKRRLIKFLLCARKIFINELMSISEKRSCVFAWRLLLKPPAQAFTFLAVSYFEKQMTGKPTRLAHVFLGLLRVHSPDAHTACLIPMLAEDGNVFRFNGRNGRKKCWEMLGAFSFLFHDTLSHIHLLGPASPNVAATAPDFWPLLNREYLSKYRLLGKDRAS